MQTKLWADMFVLGLPVLEKVLRPAIIYVFLVAGLRLGGKRELAQLNPFDLVVLLTLANSVQNAIIGDDVSVTGGIISATTLLLINYVVVRFLFKHRSLDRLIEGEKDVLIDKGKINMERLNKEAVTMPELAAAAHRQGFASLQEVERAVLEPGGIISFVGRKPTAEDTRHSELLERLDRITYELAQLRPGA
jgi:uncharacterized membrane protein YcaP (DUF421 family)